MIIDVAMQKLKALITFFEGYRETDLYNALENNEESLYDMNTNSAFLKGVPLEAKDNLMITQILIEESLRINFFLYLVNEVIASLN